MKRSPRARKPPPSCVVCGCTDQRACMPHGCMWISRRPRLCSGCFAFFMNLKDGSKLYQVLKLFGLSPVERIVELVEPSSTTARHWRDGGTPSKRPT